MSSSPILYVVCLIVGSLSSSIWAHEPTAVLSLVNRGDGRGRYALQVSGDQLSSYIRTLQNVPDSFYKGAHIITDMDESALPSVYTKPQGYEVESDQEEQQGSPLISAVKVDRPSDYYHTTSDDQPDEIEDPYINRKRYYDDVEENKYVSKKRSRDSNRQKNIWRREEVDTKVDESKKEVSESKLKLRMESLIKDLHKDEDSNKSHGHGSSDSTESSPSRDYVMKGATADETPEMDIVSQLSKSLPKDPKDLDLKTVRDLLNALIKQIEQIQSAAKSLPQLTQSVVYPVPVNPNEESSPYMTSPYKRSKEPADEDSDYTDPKPYEPKSYHEKPYEYKPMSKRQKVQRYSNRNHDDESGDSDFLIPPPSSGKRKKKSPQKEVYLKAEDLMKMLVGPSPFPISPHFVSTTPSSLRKYGRPSYLSPKVASASSLSPTVYPLFPYPRLAYFPAYKK